MTNGPPIPDYRAHLLGRGLRSIRENRDLYQKDMAAIIGVSLRMYVYFETGAKWPGPEARKKIDAALSEQEKADLQKWVNGDYE